MSGYNKLTGAVADHRRGRVMGITQQLEITGSVWDVPRLMIEVGDGVVISPVAEVRGGDVAFLLNKWEVFQLDPVVRLPMTASQADAAAIARAFQADHSISFAHSEETLIAWLTAYVAGRAHHDTDAVR